MRKMASFWYHPVTRFIAIGSIWNFLFKLSGFSCLPKHQLLREKFKLGLFFDKFPIWVFFNRGFSYVQFGSFFPLSNFIFSPAHTPRAIAANIHRSKLKPECALMPYCSLYWLKIWLNFPANSVFTNFSPLVYPTFGFSKKIVTPCWVSFQQLLLDAHENIVSVVEEKAHGARPQCSKCGKHGHTEDSCWQPRGGEGAGAGARGGNPRSRGGSSGAVVSGVDLFVPCDYCDKNSLYCGCIISDNW